MRVILSFLIGLVLGGGAMIWFYVNGGEISVAGHELGPPPKTVAVANPPGGAAAPKSTAPRVVVRDITDGTPPSSSPSPSVSSGQSSNKPPQPSGTSTPAQPGKSDDSSFFAIKWPRW